jgi:hypothetical protein
MDMRDSPKSPNRRFQGIILLVLITTTIIAVLFAANVAPIKDQCPWVFPRILSCLLSARETLFAGLTARGAALFGAWLAFVAVQDQIGMARRTEALARQIENEKKVYEAARDCDRVKSAHGYASALVSEFPLLDDPKVLKSAFAERLLELRRIGFLLPSEDAVAAPDGLGNSLKTIMNRTRTLADNLENESKNLSAEMRGQRARGYRGCQKS